MVLSIQKHNHIDIIFILSHPWSRAQRGQRTNYVHAANQKETSRNDWLSEEIWARFTNQITQLCHIYFEPSMVKGTERP